MSVGSIRRLTAAIVITAAAGAVFIPGGASAQPVETGSLAFTSDQGDPVGQGGSYSYSVTSGDEFSVASRNDNNILDVAVQGTNGDQWDLTFAAPPGQALVPGEYDVPGWRPGNDGPGLYLSGNGRACYATAGSFTIDNITFGPSGYVQVVDATYVQYCYGGSEPAPALRGEVHIANRPPPAPLELGATIDPAGTVSRLSGSATVHGTVSCTEAVTVQLSVLVTQVAKHAITRGYDYPQVACTPDQPATWAATAHPYGTTPYQKGDAEVTVFGWATDPLYNTQITVQQVGSVRLGKTAAI